MTKRDKPQGSGQGVRRVSHDAFIRRHLSDPKKARAFIRCFLPPKIVARLADQPPELLDTQHVNGRLRPSRSDLRLRAALKDGGFIDINLEHKAHRATDVHRQMHRYHRNIIGSLPQELADQLEDEPVVVHLLVYHGPGRWNPQVTMKGERADEAVAGFKDLDLDDFRRFRIVFVDLKGYAIDELTEDPELQAALYAMAQDSTEALRQIYSRLPPGIARDEVEAYLYLNWNTPDDALESVQQEFKRNGRRTTMGRTAKGLIRKGQATALLTQLRFKFGRLSAGVRERVSAATADQLDAWAVAVLSADSLDEVFASKG